MKPYGQVRGPKWANLCPFCDCLDCGCPQYREWFRSKYRSRARQQDRKIVREATKDVDET